MRQPIIMPQRLAHDAQPGELSKRVIVLAPRVKNMRTPLRDEEYLAMVRNCPCLRCGMDPAGEAAHVRMSSAAHGKRNSGMRETPSDNWVAPVCRACHQNDPDSIHRIGELTFWHRVGLNPILVCLKLYSARGDLVRMRAICFNAIAERESADQARNER